MKATNTPALYTRDAVLDFLEKVRPEVPWRELVGERLPPIVWRSRWNKLRDSLGLPYSRGQMQNLDSEGRGPERLRAAQ